MTEQDYPRGPSASDRACDEVAEYRRARKVPRMPLTEMYDRQRDKYAAEHPHAAHEAAYDAFKRNAHRIDFDYGGAFDVERDIREAVDDDFAEAIAPQEDADPMWPWFIIGLLIGAVVAMSWLAR